MFFFRMFRYIYTQSSKYILFKLKMGYLNQISFRVRYSETDQMGVVYHGNYAQYLEMGRVEWLRSLGYSYKSMEENGIMFPVFSLSLNFKKSATYDDLITCYHAPEKIACRPHRIRL